jgi:hypothetical protein
MKNQPSDLKAGSQCLEAREPSPCFRFLLEPVTAANQTNRIMDVADSLDHMPLRHLLYDKEPWRSRGLRVMPVANYLAFLFAGRLRQS